MSLNSNISIPDIKNSEKVHIDGKPLDLINNLPSTPPKKLDTRVMISQEGISVENSSKSNDINTPTLEELLNRFNALKKF